MFVTVSSCSVKEINNPEAESFLGQSDRMYYAIIEEQPGNVDTKTYADSQLRVLWNEGDHVTIFDKKTLNEEFCFDGEDGDNSGGFYPTPSSGGYVSYSDLTYSCSVYPYQRSTKISYDGIVTFTLPAEQTYAPNSFGRGANTMIAKTETNQLKFKNVGGYLSFKFYGQGVSVTSIDLKGNNGELLAGKCTISMESGDPVTTMASSNTSDQITLICSPSVELSSSSASPTEFWIVVPPTTFSQGITFTVHTSDGGVFERSSNANFTLGRNKKMQIPVMEVIPEYVQPNNVIYYTSTDGTIVTPYATDVFGASILTNEYVDGRGVLTFDGGVTSIGDYAFYHKSTLSSIIIPDSVTTIGDYAFDNCSGFTGELILPDGLTTIGEYAFRESSWFYFLLPESLIRIGSGAFERCKLKSFPWIPPKVTVIESHTFAKCNIGDNYLAIPGNVKIIGESAFSDCIFECSEFHLEEGVEIISDNAFSSCVFPKPLDCNLPSSIERIGAYAFNGCENLYSITVGAIVPPIGGEGMFNNTNDSPIYVPSESVDAYKTASGWRNYADRIQAAPEAVDLGLPSGIKWASFNLGANKPEEYGDYYAWGETDNKNRYTWTNYMFRVTGDSYTNVTFSKYNTKADRGTVDNKTQLDLSDDAAHVILGGNWRMPTDAEWTELRENCIWTWTTQNGVNGRLVTAGNGNSIFLPAAGSRNGSSLYNAGQSVYYWSSTLDTDYPYRAYYVYFNSSGVLRVSIDRNYGQSIRPVTE